MCYKTGQFYLLLTVLKLPCRSKIVLASAPVPDADSIPADRNQNKKLTTRVSFKMWELALQAAHSLASECRSGLQIARGCCLFNALHPASVPDANSFPACRYQNKKPTTRVSFLFCWWGGDYRITRQEPHKYRH